MYTGEGVGGVWVSAYLAASEAYPTPGPSPLKRGGVTRCAGVLKLRGFGHVCQRGGFDFFTTETQRAQRLFVYFTTEFNEYTE